MTKKARGIAAEEALRAYFRNLEYFPVRGIMVRFAGQDVTDIDVWLYRRASPISRERINVDVKSGGRPKALERTLWARGVQSVFGFDRCVVATSERRESAGQFARSHGVTLIGGELLDTIIKRDFSSRFITDEQLQAMWNSTGLDKHVLGIGRRIEEAKRRLVVALDFDGINATLDDTCELLAAWMAAGVREEAVARAAYLLVSYLLVQLDFALAPVALAPLSQRQELLADGLRFGSEGAVRNERLVSVVKAVVTSFVDESGGLAGQIERELRDSAQALPIDGLVEYFSDNRTQSGLFKTARKLESAAYERKFVPSTALDADARAAIAVLADYAEVPRRALLRDQAESSTTAEVPESNQSEKDGDAQVALTLQDAPDEPAAGHPTNRSS